MSSNSLPILYTFRRCPYAIRARMAVFSTGIDVDLQEVSLRDKPQSMLDIFSKGIVPVLFVTNLRKSLKETFCRFVCRCFSFTKKYSNERRHHKKCTYN